MYKIQRTTWALRRRLGVLASTFGALSVTVTILSIPLTQLRGVIIPQRLSVASSAIDHPFLGRNNNKGWWASTGLGKTPRSRYRGGFAPPNPPPVLVIVSDILDSEIHDRTRVLYSYSYLRGSYEIEADLTMH